MMSQSLPFVAIIFLGMIIEIVLPDLLRPDNLFSVTIAEEVRKHPEVQALITRWRISNAVIGLVVAGACAATGMLPQASSILPVLLTSYPLLVAAVYMVFHRFALAFALPAQGATKRVASLRPRPSGSMLIPYRWELLPLAVIVLTVVLLAIRYANAPAIIPIHFDLTGHANRFAAKSVWTFFSIVGLQFGEWVVLTLFGISLGMARVAPSTGTAGTSYRHWWARLIFTIKVGTVILLSISVLLTTSNSPSGALAGPMAVLMFVSNVPILVLMLTLALRYGQSGWRQLRKTGSQLTVSGDATPDRAWKGGLFYYNPDDPALFVEKRSGLGWTVNLGRPQARLVLVVLLLVPLVLGLLPLLSKP